MFKDDVIYQIQKDYGMSKKEATDFYNRIDEDMRKEFYAEHETEITKSFWED